MPSLDRRVGLVRRGFQYVADSDPVRSFAIPFMHQVDGWLLDSTGGRTSATGMLLGLPIVALTTTGAKSGKERRSILTGIPHGDDATLVIASNFGQEKHPAWYHNVRANPRVALEVSGSTPQPHDAELLSGREWDDAWELTTWHYRGYDTYRQRTDRPIPIVRLAPATG